MIQIFTLTLAANEAREVAVSGEYFELRNAIFPIALIELLDRSGSVISRLENPEQSDYVKPGRYETIRITNGPTAQAIRHFYGSGDAGSRRTSGTVQVEGTVNVAGTVAVIDGEVAKSKLSMAFIANAYMAAVGAQYPYLELWNPVGSGKRAIVSDAVFSTGANGPVGIFKTTALITAAGFAVSKLSGGVASVVKVGGATIAALPGVKVEENLILSYQPFVRTYKQPFVVEPGAGLMIAATQVSLNAYLSMQFTEEAYP